MWIMETFVLVFQKSTIRISQVKTVRRLKKLQRFKDIINVQVISFSFKYQCIKMTRLYIENKACKNVKWEKIRKRIWNGQC